MSHLNWDNYHVVILEISSSKSKLLKAGGQVQVHNVLKRLHNGAHCVLLTFVSKIAFLVTQGALNINLDFIFFREKKTFENHLGKGWLASFLFNKFNSFLFFLETLWQTLTSPLQSFFFLNLCPFFIFFYSDLFYMLKAKEKIPKDKTVPIFIVFMFISKNYSTFSMLLFTKYLGKSLHFRSFFLSNFHIKRGQATRNKCLYFHCSSVLSMI